MYIEWQNASKVSSFFCVSVIMKGKIIDYLTMEYLSESSFEQYSSKRIRCAWILAKKKYSKLSKEEKQQIIKKINERNK